MNDELINFKKILRERKRDFCRNLNLLKLAVVCIAKNRHLKGKKPVIGGG